MNGAKIITSILAVQMAGSCYGQNGTFFSTGLPMLLIKNGGIFMIV
jgi:hypothetical protein